MKGFAFASLLIAPLAVAQPHHQHRHAAHHAKRVPEVTQVVPGPETTVVMYELYGKNIGADEVCNGIKSGKYKWADGNPPEGACKPAAPAPAPAPSTTSPPAQPSVAPAEFYQKSSESQPEPSSTPEPAPSPSPEPSPSPSQGSDSGSDSHSSSGLSGGQGLDTPFSDGEMDCSSFPSDFGAMKLDYLGFGGWASLQDAPEENGAFNNIHTPKNGDCNEDGRFCGYACPEGYLQTQWPQMQGATGQSVGGIQCRNGKLHLTNTDYDTLCTKGAGNVQIKNQASGVIATCRTYYPGTEEETIPVEAQPGETKQLACPVAEKFYHWKGMATSAQYYMNNAGVTAEEGCKWGDPSQDRGNYAPVNFGVGQKDGLFWLSIMKNEPTTSANFQGKITIEGDDVNGDCTYDHGSFSGSGATGNGCTVSSASGDVTYVVSN